MFTPQPIDPGTVPAALAKAERYRLLNDPSAAESICLDVVEVDPDNQTALVMLLLARTDQFGTTGAAGVVDAREILGRISSSYQRAYYAGVIAERQAMAILRAGTLGKGPIVHGHLREAMDHYEEAQRLSPPDTNEAVLRWNTCVRILARDPSLVPPREERAEPVLGE